MRIQFTERYMALTEEEVETFENLNPGKKPPYAYRLIYPRLDDIDMPVELPSKKELCGLLFYSGDLLIVKGSFQDVCLLLDRREAQDEGDSLGES